MRLAQLGLALLLTGLAGNLSPKGEDSAKDKAKRDYLDEWVNAVNAHGGFGTWKWRVCMNPSDVATVIHDAVVG